LPSCGETGPKAFLEALADTFDTFGREILKTVRDTDPVTYASVFAGVMPADAALGFGAAGPSGGFADRLQLPDTAH